MTVRLEFPATSGAVRRALAALRRALAPLALSSAELDSVELVLAEVLNNVVEHAYAGTETGRVMVTAWRVSRDLAFRIEDEGCPMPGGTLPPGSAPVTGTPLHELPEGGFGWFMIHNLTRDLDYCRIGARNCLTFRLSVGSPQPG